MHEIKDDYVASLNRIDARGDGFIFEIQLRNVKQGFVPLDMDFYRVLEILIDNG